MDQIFKALNDPTRRALLDTLRERDGQSLGDLETRINLTRVGVMKHLSVLEDAGLVVTRKVGRFKYHYLNPLPLQDMMDRWVAPSRITYDIAVEGDFCCLTVLHEDLVNDPSDGTGDGWFRSMAGLKTYLETGKPAHFGGAYLPEQM